MTKYSRNSFLKDGEVAGLYDLQETLGCGHFAVVKVARHVFTGERVAVKVIDKTKLDEVARAHLIKEVRCMKLVQHPNVVRLYEVIDTQTKLYLVQELGDGGDMYEYIMNHEQGLCEEKARHYFQQIVLAIDYCHKLHIVHRDLKLENVIFFKSLDVAKLTDFGFSNKFTPGHKLDTACGSLAYSAPEVLLGDSYEAPAVDIWSLGVILFMLVCGRAPFYEINDSETLINIMDVRYSVSDHVSQACQSLIEKMLVREPYLRCSLDDIMKDPWFQGSHPPILPTPVPLVTELPLTPEEHNYVAEKLQEGNIADRETLQKSLEDNTYDHVTAAYYLLAEQLLRRLKSTNNSFEPAIARRRNNGRRSLQEHKRQDREPKSSIPAVEGIKDRGNDSEAHSDSESGSSTPRSRRSSSGRLAPREGQMLNETIKAHAIEADEVLHSSMEEDDLVPSSLHIKHGKIPSTSALPEPSTSTNLQFSTESMHTSNSPSVSRPHERKFGGRHGRFPRTSGNPLGLNQIHEERESDLDDSPVNSPRVERTRRHLGAGLMKSKRTTRRLSPVHSGGSRRSSSCSSSDEDEIERHMHRLKTNSGCKLNSWRASPEDPSSDGDSGGGTSVGGSGGVSKRSAGPSNGSSNGEHSTDKTPPSKQESGRKSQCLNITLGLNGFAPLCENLCAIDESNKENVDNNLMKIGEGTSDIKAKLDAASNGKRSPLIEECDVLGSKGNGEVDRNSFCKEKRNSASKYIQTTDCEEECRTQTANNGDEKPEDMTTCDSVEAMVNFELNDTSVHSKDTLKLVEDSKINKNFLQKTTMQTVTSNCCRIF